MKNIKVGTKLVGSFLFVAALTAFMGIYTLRGLEHLDEATDLMYDKGAIPLGMLTETTKQAQEMRINVWKFQRAKTNESRAELIKAIDESHTVIKELIVKQRDITIDEAGKKVLDDLRAATDRFVTEAHNYMRSAKIDPVTGISAEDIAPAAIKAAGEMLQATASAIDARTNSTKALSDNATKVQEGTTSAITMLLIAVLLISVSLGLYMAFSITRPLKIILTDIGEMEKGDMTTSIAMDRNDELGTLSRAQDGLSVTFRGIFNDLQQKAETIAGSAEELSSVGRQVTGNAEANIAQSTSVTNSMEQTSVNINTMASGAEQASANANEVASAAEQMSMNMNTIASAIEEMSASISEIASNAGDASNIAHEATVRSHEATDVMGKLGAAAKEIGQVTDVIKKIADKTNLLALNATIEAASAGEAGKGFAVVASEIKDLANQSATSADDIARRIEGIQSGTGEAITVINSVSEIVAKINHSVDAISSHVSQQTKASNEIASNVAQANAGAKRVASAIGEVAKGSGNIAHNAGEAAKSVNAVSREVIEIANGAKDSAQGAKQINQSADELSRLASDLRKILSRFKI